MTTPPAPMNFSQAAKTNWRTILASAVIVAAIVGIALVDGLPALKTAKYQWLPFVSALVGVTLYTMSSAKVRREYFDYRYLPDYCFRGAQAVVYLYVILAILAQTQNGGAEFTNWPPNLLGLFIGMFILHVEKAMEGLGQRFEEVLAGFLPRSLAAPTSREKEIRRIRLDQKFEDIKTQAEGLVPLIRDPALREQLQARLAEVTRVVRDGDDKLVHDAVGALAWDFEQLKVGTREESLTVAEILGSRRETSARGKGQ